MACSSNALRARRGTRKRPTSPHFGHPSALAERTLLYALAGHCHAPIAGHATAGDQGEIRLAARVYAPDGSAMLACTLSGPDTENVGIAVAENLIGEGVNELLASSRRS
ncbi:hypothetical protein [Streptomyces sp. NPDC092903]|uniref:hypothetical protein n=1 Tax=Streptomyces sp. NPDC092903 TaxID=3366017 RepID=UPI003816CC7D